MCDERSFWCEVARAKPVEHLAIVRVGRKPLRLFDASAHRDVFSVYFHFFSAIDEGTAAGTGRLVANKEYCAAFLREERFW